MTTEEKKNLTVKIFVILAATTLVVWFYSIDNINVQDIVESSIKNLYNKSINPTNYTPTDKSISNDNSTQNYYLSTEPTDKTNTQK